jgi:uncharacterized protein (TIGR03437 family)
VTRFSLSLSLIFALQPSVAQQYTVSTVAGGAAPASAASAAQVSIGDPPRVAVDSAGNFYFAGLHSVFKVAPTGVLTRIAGNGRCGYSGDGGSALSAQLSYPDGIAVDPSGNVYVADLTGHVVRRISAAGSISTYAGNGAPGYSGDGGSAAAAQLDAPAALALDSAGNLYIADTGNNRIRKVSLNGTISTYAGTGIPGYSGDGGAAASAMLDQPQGIAVDSAGNLYIADTINNRIRQVSPAGAIATVAGNGLATYSGDNVGGTGIVSSSGDGGPATQSSVDFPTDVAVDSAGDLYIADYANSKIRIVNSQGVIDTLIGNEDGIPLEDGQAAAAIRLNGPTGVVVDPSGIVYFTEGSIGDGSGLAGGDFKVWKVAAGIFSTAAGNGIESFAGDGGAATIALLNAPAGVASDAAGNIYIADSLNNRIRKLSPNGLIVAVAGNGAAGFSGDGGPATSGQFNGPQGVAVDSSGTLYIADTRNNRIRLVTSQGILYTIGGNGNPAFFGDGGPATTAAIHAPSALAVDRAGDLFVADTLDQRVREILPNNVIQTIAGAGTAGYSGDGGPAVNAQLNAPAGIAVDSSGNVFVADTGNNRIRVISPSGTIATLAPAAKFAAPAGIAVDSSGNVFIADTGNNRIVEALSSGSAVTIAGAGAGACCYSGDGGPAASALFNSPAGLALDPSANLYIADTANNAVRRLQSATVVPAISAIVNAASNAPGAISPGEIVVIQGAGLGPPELATAPPFGVTVAIGGISAPVIYASNTQLSAIVPYEVSGAPAAVSVQYLAQAAAQTTAPVAAASPAIFTANESGAGQALAINQDGSRNSATSPAPAGALVTLYATGLGQTSPPGVDGQIATNFLPIPILPIAVTVGGQSAGVLAASAVPGAVAGMFQLQVQLPVGVSGSQVLVTVQAGAFTSPSVTIAVAAR